MLLLRDVVRGHRADDRSGTGRDPLPSHGGPCLAAGRLGVDPPRGDGRLRVHGAMDLVPKPDQVVSAASNVAHKVLYGGLADLRPMPRTLIDEGELREVYHYRPVATAREQGDPVLLVTPLAAPALCFDLRRGCSLVEHFVEAGRPTYLVEYGEVSFKNRALGIEHWVDEVVPTAVEEVSKHAGGRPVHLVGWSLGGIFSLLAAADRRDLPIASVTVVGSPGRRQPGAAGRPAAAAPELHRRPAADAGLPGDGRRPEATGEVGLPALVVPEADHQAARGRDPSRRCRLPRPDRGGGPVHRQHDRLPRPQLRPALPPVRAQQRAQHGRFELGDRTIDLAAITAPVLVFAGATDGIAPVGAVKAVVPLLSGAAEVRFEIVPGRPPRDADRPGRPRLDLAGARRVGRPVVDRATSRRRPSRRPARKKSAKKTVAKKPATKPPASKKSAAKTAATRKPSPDPDAIGVNPTRRYGSASSRSLAR